MKERNRIPLDEISFYSLVKDCAAEPQLVASFNQAYGANLQAPITALLDDRWPNHVSEEEEILIGYFILFIHEHIWLRLKRAQHRMWQARTGRVRQAGTGRRGTQRPIDSPPTQAY